MKQIIFVTSNQGKFLSARHFLKKYNIRVVQKDLAAPESRDSIEAIAIQKARYAYKTLRQPLIAMDTGFFIHSLGGFPKMFTNFVLQTIGLKGIIKLTKGKGKACEFKEVLCYCDSLRAKPKLFTRIVKGKLTAKPRGKFKPHLWSELSLIFVPTGQTKTMGEMNKKEFAIFRKHIDTDSHWERFAKFFQK